VSAEPRDVQRDRREYYQWLQTEELQQFGAVFKNQHSGEVESYARWAPSACEAEEQLELKLPGYSKHHWIRHQLADALEKRVLPICGAKWVHNYVDRLRRARWEGAYGYSIAKGKAVMFWDDKAGLSRLCPDDAREESQRLSRKVLGPLEALQGDGHALHYLVLTTPNAVAGTLRREMASICRRFRNSILRAKHADGSLLFPEIKGALCVLEAPLGAQRDWNVHLNVILVVKGYLDYEKLRRRWHWNLHARKLPQGPGVIRGALMELIKYAVAATVAKSAEKAAQESDPDPGDRPPAPPMLEWNGDELLEWLKAMRGFRRSRTYGCLFRLKRPPKEDLGQIIWLGRVNYEGGRYRLASALLRSITEDKSIGRSGAERWLALTRALKPHAVEDLAGLFTAISRDVVHRTALEAEIL